MKHKARFIINSTVSCPFQEVDSCSADQGVACLSWNLKVCYCVHKNPTLGPNLSNLNSVHTLVLIYWKAVYNIIFSLKRLPVQWFSSHLTFCTDRESLYLLQTSVKMSDTDSGCSKFQFHVHFLLFSSCLS